MRIWLTEFRLDPPNSSAEAVVKGTMAWSSGFEVVDDDDDDEPTVLSTPMTDMGWPATSSGTLSAAYQEADAELLSLHGVTTAASADFTITSEQQVLSTATSVDKTLTILLGGVAGISLLVGGIGVMNIMLVSV